MSQTKHLAAESIRRPRVDRRLLAPKLYYFLHFGAMACVAPFLVLYYRQVGLSGAKIGLLTGLAPMVAWLSAPLWGAVADANRRHREMLLIAIAGALISVVVLVRTTDLLWLAPVVALYAFFSAPIVPLVDNSVMGLLGEKGYRYGQQRLWGAVGWGLAGLAAGVVAESHGLLPVFGGYALLMSLALVVAVRLEVYPSAVGQPFRVGVRRLVAHGPLLVFLLTILVAGMGMSLIHSYLFLYMQDMGSPATLMGLSLTIATVSEVPVFLFSGRLIRALGARGVLLCAVAAMALRLGLYAIMPAPWIVLPVNLLHGLTFSAIWVAGVSYANEVSPPGLSATGQGLFSGILLGLGAAAGALIGGMLYDSVGGASMYAIGAAWVTAGLVLFAVAGRRGEPTTVTQ